MAEHDPVNHPAHYTDHPSGVETIELTRLLPFSAGNAVKYVMRRDLKGDPLENLAKAEWYLNDAIDNRGEYTISRAMIYTVEHVIPAEPNATVIRLLQAMLTYRDHGRRFGAEPDLILARDLVRALMKEYQ